MLRTLPWCITAPQARCRDELRETEISSSRPAATFMRKQRFRRATRRRGPGQLARLETAGGKPQVTAPKSPVCMSARAAVMRVTRK